VLIVATCLREPCRATATARIFVRGRSVGFRLNPARQELGSGQRVTLRLRVGLSAVRGVRRALRRGHAVRAAILVVVVDAAGNRTVRDRTIRITAPI